MTEHKIRTSMSDEDIDIIADFMDVPANKVRGIVWLTEKFLNKPERQHYPMFPLVPIPGSDGTYEYNMCQACGPVCNNVICPNRTVVTHLKETHTAE